MNNSGQVTGYSYLPSGQTRGFRTAPNRAINPATDAFGTLGGTSSSGSAINSSGQVAGSSTLGNGHTHAIRVDADGSIHDLGVLGGSIDFSLANGINDLGQVTGASGHLTPGTCFGIGGSVAFLTSPNSSMTASDDLGTLLGGCRGSDGYGVNNSGQVAGYSASSSLANPLQNAIVATSSGMTDLGLLGGVSRFPAVSGMNATAYAINASGMIAGVSTYNHDSTIAYSALHAFLSTPTGPLTDIGTLGGSYSTAFGINTAGQIVGSATTVGDAALHGFLYSGGTILDLNNMIGSASGWTINNASAINDNGQILANATFTDGSSHSVRLDPPTLSAQILTGLLSDPSLALTAGQVSSLSDKLSNVLSSIQAGQSKPAVNQLNAFINAVDAQVKTGKLTAAAGAELKTAAKAMIAALS
jgi:probable HAF family extracellular repeat protein